MSKFWKMVGEDTKKQAEDFIQRMKSGQIIWTRRQQGWSKPKGGG